MELFDFSEMKRQFENLFGKKVYEWFNWIIRAIAVIGIVLCIVSYSMGREDIFNLSNVGNILFCVYVGAIIIAALFRASIKIFKYIREHWRGISESFVIIIGSTITIIIGIVLFLLIVMISNWIFGDCSGHVDLDHVHFDKY